MFLLQLPDKALDARQGGAVKSGMHIATDVSRASKRTEIGRESAAAFSEKFAGQVAWFSFRCFRRIAKGFYHAARHLNDSVFITAGRRQLRPPSCGFCQQDVRRQNTSGATAARSRAVGAVCARERFKMTPQFALCPTIGFQGILHGESSPDEDQRRRAIRMPAALIQWQK